MRFASCVSSPPWSAFSFSALTVNVPDRNDRVRRTPARRNYYSCFGRTPSPRQVAVSGSTVPLQDLRPASTELLRSDKSFAPACSAWRQNSIHVDRGETVSPSEDRGGEFQL